MLLSLVPLPYRLLAIALLAASLFGYGYLKGRVAGEEKVEAVTAKLQSERDQQALKSAQKTIQDKEKISETVSDFHSNIAAINAYWVRQPKPAPGVSSSPQTPSGATGGCADPTTSGPYQELEQACSVTTAMFNACRDGWMKLE